MTFRGETSSDRFAMEIQQRADKISSLILHSDVPWVDIAIQIENLREFCRNHAPEKLTLFHYIYERRFQRLWRQWRMPRNGEFNV